MKRVQVLCVFLLVGCSPFFSTPVRAQAHDWLAWHGCWQADGAPAGEYLCIVPDGAAGVRLATIAGSAVVAESRIVTDGRARPVQTEGCSGTEVAFWSADYGRVFLNSELSCEAGVKRQASGIFAITGEASWKSVQAVTIDGRTATRTVSYTAVDDAVAPATIRSALRGSALDRAAARSIALAPIDADDVNEAVARIDAAAVQEWLIATGQPFQLADELAPAAGDVVTRSALDHTGYFTQDRQQPVREVVQVVERPVEVVQVVEAPVYVTHTHVHEYRYRSCWDPFFSGLVVGLGRGASIGLGHSHCGRSYLTHYSPWGYDLYGWRFVDVRPIIIAGRPVIHYREPSRPPRFIRTSRRDDDRRAADPRSATRSREDYPRRTAQPRGDARGTRTAQLPAATPGGRTTGRILPAAGTTTPTRYAQPRTPSSGSTSRAIPSTGTSPSGRIAEPRRSAPPPPPVSTGSRTRPVIEVPTRSAQPRAETRPRTSTLPPARSATSARTVQPRTSAPAPAASGVRSAPRAVQRPAAATSSSAPPTRAAAPARVARPRGGEERR